jgi:hypothetical protein
MNHFIYQLRYPLPWDTGNPSPTIYAPIEPDRRQIDEEILP